MKYINKSAQQLDQEIEQMFDLNMPNSAFKRVIPTTVRRELRDQYVEFLEEQHVAQCALENSRSVSTQVIKVNIASLREAGYCICPSELATTCELLLRQQAEEVICESEISQDIVGMNNLTNEQVHISKNQTSETADFEMDFDTETTSPKHNDTSSETAEVDKLSEAKPKKNYPAKLDAGTEFSKKSESKVTKDQQNRTNKRKYFTKYMSSEFSKDTKPVTMSMMDTKTQNLFQQKDFNELVSEITGII